MSFWGLMCGRITGARVRWSEEVEVGGAVFGCKRFRSKQFGAGSGNRVTIYRFIYINPHVTTQRRRTDPRRSSHGNPCGRSAVSLAS